MKVWQVIKLWVEFRKFLSHGFMILLQKFAKTKTNVKRKQTEKCKKHDDKNEKVDKFYKLKWFFEDQKLVKKFDETI